MEQTNLKVALAALFHDLGKFSLGVLVNNCSRVEPVDDGIWAVPVRWQFG